MRRDGRFCFALIVAVLMGGGPAFASVFEAPAPDVAQAWLDLLFRGVSLPAGLAAQAPNLDAVASALHRALGIYSLSILVIAGLLLFYNLAVMIIETAHYGIAMGRRSTQVWGPIRLVLAMGFLVPVSGGLNAGQLLVTWMAEQGSGLASRAWTTAANEMKGSFSGIALPQGPDVAGWVAGGMDMELCRSLYRHAYTGFAGNQAVRLVGNMNELTKLPRTRFAEETWQYSNRLHMSVPLCGAYRFSGAVPVAGDVTAAGSINRVSGQIADFARTETEQLTFETQGLAEANAPVFLGDVAGPGLHDQAVSLIASHRAAMNEKLRMLVTDDAGLIDRTLSASADAGWITAGGFLLELARLQGIYSTVAAQALPSVQAPILATSDFLHPRLADTIAAEPGLAALSSADITPLTTFYNQIERTTRLARSWIYDRQLADMPLMLADPFDLRDEMLVATDPASVSNLFGHVLNDAAVANGVWNSPVMATSAMAVDADKPILALPSSVQNPVMSLTEFGHRQVALGNYLFAIAGPDVAPAGTLAHALLLGATGLGFLASGFALMFLVPLLPFLRFFVGILAWLLAVFEAVIAVPVVALAHLNFSGEGLSGGAARQAYLLWLNILIRPALALFGLVMGLLLFTFGVAFLDMVFHHLMHLAAPADSEGFVTINVALTFLYTILIVAAANAAFKGISFLPEMAIKWLGGFMGAERAEVTVNASTSASAIGGQGGSSYANQIAQQRGGISGMLQKADDKLIAAAKSYGLKMALFPQYKTDDKPIGNGAHIAGSITKQDSSVSRVSESYHGVPVQPIRQGDVRMAPPSQGAKDAKPRLSKQDAVSDLSRLTEVPADAKIGKPPPDKDHP